MPSFRTALVASASVAGATHAQLTSSPSNGAPSVSDHLRSTLRSASGKRLSHAERSGVLPQLAASLFGTLIGAGTGVSGVLQPVLPFVRRQHVPCETSIRYRVRE